MPPKSIWRGPKAQHFTLVHRSQQDPLLNDAEASSRVLKSTPRRQDGTALNGQSRQQLEQQLGAVAQAERENVGEAAQYGIYFDDTKYDYMQHLRSIGGKDNSRRGGQDEERDDEVIMLEAPKVQKEVKGKARAKHGEPVEFKEPDKQAGLALPAEVLPSTDLMPRTFEEDKEAGIRPDMDPHLRQVLEALEDDAFLMRIARGTGKQASTSDEQIEPTSAAEQAAELSNEEQEEELEEDIDDFFGEIVKGGEIDAGEEEPEWRQLPPGGEESIWLDPSARAARELLELKEQGKGVEDLSLESRVALFKQAAAASREEQEGGATRKERQAPSSVGSKSIFGERGASRKSRHAGAKARHAASFYSPSVDGGATAFSMSSSAMERNQGLTGLDEQFARMERIYEQGDDEEEEEFAAVDEDGEQMVGPEGIDAIFDEFLAKNEVIGNRMRERLGDHATTPIEKVNIIRRELGEMRLMDKQTLDEADQAGLGPKVSVEELISRDLAQRANARNDWDVETIQTTKTNVENHPRTIAAAESVAPSRISRVVSGSMNGANSVALGSVAGTDRMPRIKIDPRTGKAVISGYINIGARQARREAANECKTAGMGASSDEGERADGDASSSDDDHLSEASDDTTTISNVGAGQTIKRNRNESKDEKKMRKQAAKEEKQIRKAEKSQRKAEFKAALQHRPGAKAGVAATTTGLSLR